MKSFYKTIVKLLIAGIVLLGGVHAAKNSAIQNTSGSEWAVEEWDHGGF